MARMPRLTPRKTPKQDRSRALVAAILESTRRVLLEHGPEEAAVVEIAKVAGVSPGSLYQYFPSRESLFAALHLQLLEDHIAYLGDNLLEHRESEAAEVADVIAMSQLRLWRDDGAILAALEACEPQIGSTEKLEPLRERGQRLLRAFFQSRPELEARAPLLALALPPAVWGVLRTFDAQPISDEDLFPLIAGVSRGLLQAATIA